MRCAILYICTGKYSAFWPAFFESSEKYLFPDHEKNYFVFTDDLSIVKRDHVFPYYQEYRGFPSDSLLRFDMFMQVIEKLEMHDYIFFMNANVMFVSKVGQEILPCESNEGLTGVLHAGYLHSSPFWMPFERRKKSKAFVPPGLGKYHYYLGGINGGTSESYLKMIKTCRQNIQSDLDSGIVAFYHDESHINQYFAGKNILRLSPSYGYPEGWNLPYEPKILILNKVKHGGACFDKLPERSYLQRGKLFLKRLTDGLLWYLK